MRYKIVELNSGEVRVYREIRKHEAKTAEEFLTGWSRLEKLFVSFEDAAEWVKEVKKLRELDSVRREEVFDV